MFEKHLAATVVEIGGTYGGLVSTLDIPPRLRDIALDFGYLVPVGIGMFAVTDLALLIATEERGGGG